MSSVTLPHRAPVAHTAAPRAASAKPKPHAQGMGPAMFEQLRESFDEILANTASARKSGPSFREKDRASRRGGAPATGFAQSNLTDDAPAKLAELDRLLADAKRHRGNPQALLDDATRLFKDPSDVALALAELDARGALGAPAEALVAAALQLNDARYTPKAVRAGIHAGLPARQAAGEALRAPALRDVYRLLVAGETSAPDFYGHIVDTFGVAQRGKVLRFLERTCVIDKYAHDPSATAAEFGDIDASLGKLRLIGSTDSVFCAKLADAFGQRARAVEVLRQGIDVLRATLQCTDGDARSIETFAHAVLRFADQAPGADGKSAAPGTGTGATARAAGGAVLRFAGPAQRAHGARSLERAFATLPAAMFVDAASRMALLASLHHMCVAADAPTISGTAWHVAPIGVAAPQRGVSHGAANLAGASHAA